VKLHLRCAPKHLRVDWVVVLLLLLLLLLHVLWLKGLCRLQLAGVRWARRLRLCRERARRAQRATFRLGF
jgi:hypothetical protein